MDVAQSPAHAPAVLRASREQLLLTAIGVAVAGPRDDLADRPRGALAIRPRLEPRSNRVAITLQRGSKRGRAGPSGDLDLRLHLLHQVDARWVQRSQQPQLRLAGEDAGPAPDARRALEVQRVRAEPVPLVNRDDLGFSPADEGAPDLAREDVRP